MSNYNNPVLALISTDSEDDFIRDVVEAYFANPTHVRTILTEDCIESCLDAYMDAQTVELDLSDLPCNQDGFTKPSRKNRGRKKSNKCNKKSKADRFHGSRKSYWKHQYKKWSANERRTALDRNGFGALHASHRIQTEDAMPFNADTNDNDWTLTCKCKDGNVMSCTMSVESWLAPVWDEEKQKPMAPITDWSEVEEREEIPSPNFFDEDEEDYSDPDSYEDDEFDYDEDDEIIEIEEDDYVPSCEFSAIEMADMSMKMATATPEQRTKIRNFFRSL